MERLRNSESRWEHPQHLGTLRFASVHFKEHVDLLWTQIMKAWSIREVVVKVLGPRLTHKKPKGRHQQKKNVFFRALSESPTPHPPWLQFGQLGPLFRTSAGISVYRIEILQGLQGGEGEETSFIKQKSSSWKRAKQFGQLGPFFRTSKFKGWMSV